MTQIENEKSPTFEKEKKPKKNEKSPNFKKAKRPKVKMKNCPKFRGLESK